MKGKIMAKITSQADIDSRQAAEDEKYRKRAKVALANMYGRYGAYDGRHYVREAFANRDNPQYVAALHNQLDR